MSSQSLIHIFEIVRRRQKRRAAEERSWPRRALNIGAYFIGGIGVALALLAVAALPLYVYVTANLPDVGQFEELLNPQNGTLLQPTRFFDCTGEHELMSLQPAGAERQFIDANENQFLADAFVAASDPEFWTRGNFIPPHLGQPRTLAEQTAARVLLASEPNSWRKSLRAWMLGAAANQRYGRAQILTWALNGTPFGHWTFGAQSAAKFYFGKELKDLTLSEGAMLAGVARAPDLNPLDTPELAKQFRDLVLVAMRDQGTISDEELSAALAEPISLVAPSELTYEALDFTQLALMQAESQLGKEIIERGGLRVITTLDYDTQATLTAPLSAEAQAVVLDPINGRIVALLGNVSDQHDAENIFLPFDYLGSFANGKSPASLVWDVSPDQVHGLGPVSMRQALANGYQFAAENVKDLVGQAQVNSILRAAGFSDEETASALDVAIAYGILSNSGLQAGKMIDGLVQPAAVLFVTNEKGEVLLDWSSPDLAPIFSSQLTYLVTDVLQDVSVRKSIQSLNRPTALAPDGGPHWQVGYTPQRVLAIWSEQPTDFNDLFTQVHAELPIRNWQIPGGLSSVIVCVPSGLLPSEDCQQTRREVFLSGTEPRTIDNLFERVAINSLNGKLATVFTPQKFVDEKLFLNTPSNDQQWAQAAGLLAPLDYDTVSSLDSGATIRIDVPFAFSQAQGVISIIGSVGDEAASYDVQVGQGLRPTKWLQIASSDRPPSDDLLATWDTSGLTGLWAIQLQVWDANGNLQRAYTIVTIGD